MVKKSIQTLQNLCVIFLKNILSNNCSKDYYMNICKIYHSEWVLPMHIEIFQNARSIIEKAFIESMEIDKKNRNIRFKQNKKYVEYLLDSENERKIHNDILFFLVKQRFLSKKELHWILHKYIDYFFYESDDKTLISFLIENAHYIDRLC